LSVCRELFVANIERVDLIARHGQCQTTMCTYFALAISKNLRVYVYKCVQNLNIEKINKRNLYIFILFYICFRNVQFNWKAFRKLIIYVLAKTKYTVQEH